MHACPVSQWERRDVLVESHAMGVRVSFVSVLMLAASEQRVGRLRLSPVFLSRPHAILLMC